MEKRKKSEKRQRNKFISIRATESEKQMFIDLASQSGLTPADYFRKSALHMLPLKPTIETKLLSQMLANWGRIGNNLNQVAKHYNAGNATDQKIGLELIEIVKDIRTDLRKSLGYDM